MVIQFYVVQSQQSNIRIRIKIESVKTYGAAVKKHSASCWGHSILHSHIGNSDVYLVCAWTNRAVVHLENSFLVVGRIRSQGGTQGSHLNDAAIARATSDTDRSKDRGGVASNRVK